MAEKDTTQDVLDVDASPDPKHVDDELYEEHEDSGLAIKALIAVGLVLAGGVLSLWVGPKIAPSLPAGMAPVADWLAPGGSQMDAEIAELKAAIADIPAPMSVAEVEALITRDVGATSETLSAQMVALSDQISATDSTEIESRISALELATNGLSAELASLVSQLSDVAASGGAVSDATSAQIATYASALDGLKAQIATLAAQNGALSQKIDDVSVVATRQVEEAETKVSEVEVSAEIQRNDAAIQSALDSIDVALAAGLPFGSALSELSEAGVENVPTDLAHSTQGVASMAQLRADFPAAAHEAIRAAITASAGDGVFSKLGALTRAQVAGRSLTPQEGLDPDAVLSRAEAALKRDDLAAALAEIDALPTAASTVDEMADWIAQANARLGAVTAFEALISSRPSE